MQPAVRRSWPLADVQKSGYVGGIRLRSFAGVYASLVSIAAMLLLGGTVWELRHRRPCMRVISETVNVSKVVGSVSLLPRGRPS